VEAHFHDLHAGKHALGSIGALLVKPKALAERKIGELSFLGEALLPLSARMTK
jgi:hypothetical protein